MSAALCSECLGNTRDVLSYRNVEMADIKFVMAMGNNVKL